MKQPIVLVRVATLSCFAAIGYHGIDSSIDGGMSILAAICFFVICGLVIAVASMPWEKRSS